MLPLNFDNFFPHLINHPDDTLDGEDRKWAWVASVILGVFTAGAVHAGCALYEWLFLAKNGGELTQTERKVEKEKEKQGLGKREGQSSIPDQQSSIPDQRSSIPVQEEVRKEPEAYEEIPSIPPECVKYFKKVPKKFTQKIFISTKFTAEEKSYLFDIVTAIYKYHLTEKELVGDLHSLEYLNYFAMRNPQLQFRTIPGFTNGLSDCLRPGASLLNEEKINKIIEVCQGYSLFGHCLSVRGSHRTGFVIDLINKTVEFYDSIGGREVIEENLKKLAEKLSQKYKTSFSYHNKTEGLRLQPDGFQCGVWIPKLLEERAKQGINFDPKTLKRFKIANYRNHFFYFIFKNKFYQRVGRNRLMEHLIEQDPEKEVQNHPIWKVPEIDKEVSSLTYLLGKTGKMPQELLSLIEESEKKS